MKTKFMSALMMMIFILGCEQDINFWNECARLDQGVVEVTNKSGIAFDVDVTRGSVEPGENDPIDLPAMDVSTQFQGIYKGEAKVWIKLKGENKWVLHKRVQVTPCEKTYCIINFEDIQQ